MKKLILILFCLGLMGCMKPLDKTTEHGGAWEVIKIDNCQYLITADGYRGYFAHKGDCDNPIHEHNRKD